MLDKIQETESKSRLGSAAYEWRRNSPTQVHTDTATNVVLISSLDGQNKYEFFFIFL